MSEREESHAYKNKQCKGLQKRSGEVERTVRTERLNVKKEMLHQVAKKRMDKGRGNRSGFSLEEKEEGG